MSIINKSRINQIHEAFDVINKAVAGITDDSIAIALLLQEVCRGTASICGLCGGNSLCKAENKHEKRLCEDFNLKGEEGEDDSTRT